MTKVRMFIIEELGELFKTEELAKKAVQEYTTEWKLEGPFTISEYWVDRTESSKEDSSLRDWERQYNTTEAELVPELKKEGYSKKQIKDIIFQLDMGATMDSALQQFFM